MFRYLDFIKESKKEYKTFNDLEFVPDYLEENSIRYEEIYENVILFKSEYKDRTIMYEDLIIKYGIDKSIEILNNLLKGEEVYYIASSHAIYANYGDKPFVVNYFKRNGNLIYVNMFTGSGTAIGLILVNKKIPKNFDEGLIDIKKIKRPDIDPFDEEDWGWEE